MKPAATQMPPPFWQARNAHLDEEKNAPRPPPRISTTPLIVAPIPSSSSSSSSSTSSSTLAVVAADAPSNQSEDIKATTTVPVTSTPLPPVPLTGVYYSDGSYGMYRHLSIVKPVHISRVFVDVLQALHHHQRHRQRKCN
jgi:hypothetical protein